MSLRKVYLLYTDLLFKSNKTLERLLQVCATYGLSDLLILMNHCSQMPVVLLQCVVTQGRCLPYPSPPGGKDLQLLHTSNNQFIFALASSFTSPLVRPINLVIP